ncbi:Alpha/Beta hydrolase protein [Neurospora hispaniola]|uniref:Carboxypeptidase n=1 Tax=Neurospora hispaniola TaxID=588809 RepID=A0AAJ0IHF0_9PEZI|nr:Alpha/Beta hydrolase protein [Neurospora hispaniola]
MAATTTATNAGRSMASWKRLSTLIVAFTLSWTSSFVAAAGSADYFVHDLPGAPDGPLVKMHAGHIEVNPDNNGNLFFWHFQNKHIANKQRTVIWLNGGPGCSSEDGALMEIGPYRLKDENTLVYNDGAWNEFANVLFVDNPVGTGFSYVDTNAYIHELTEMAANFVTFLERWFALFPEYEHDDLYIAGESYAGQHIPYIAQAILERNKNAGPVNRKWNLSGLLIGNGWVSPKEQYDAYLQFAYEKGIVKKGTDLANKLEIQQRICQKEIAVKPDKIDYPECEAILQDMLQLTAGGVGASGKNQCYNMYDVRLKDDYPSCGMAWPPDLKSVTPYLRKKEVIKALNINENKSTGWTECNGQVGMNFNPKTKPSITLLPDILSAGVPILLFSGAEDLICNHLGTEALISNMEWNGGKGFELTPGTWATRRDWTFEGEPAGFWQQARNLTYVLFYNSSHMVPFDYPRRTRDMLDRFMGVDISSIGGQPTDSRLDGEKLPETTVGGAAGNSTSNQAAEKAKLEMAKWEAYRKSGELVLVIVIVAAGVWGWFVWKDRRKTAGQGYMGVATGERHSISTNPGPRGNLGSGDRTRGQGLAGFRNKRSGRRDVEAQDFDESELDDLHLSKPEDPHADSRYSIGGASDDEEEQKPGKGSSSRQPGGRS